MNIELVSRSIVKEMIREENSRRFAFVYRELTYLRRRMVLLEEELKILKKK